MSTIMIRGPFTELEMASIVLVLQGIEAARPEETFEMHVDDETSDVSMAAFLEKISPLREGYERVLRYRHVKPRGG